MLFIIKNFIEHIHKTLLEINFKKIKKHKKS